MITPRYIREGLRSINDLYFAVFNPHIRDRKSMSYGRGRWQIRKWTGCTPKRQDLWDCHGYSEIIFTICQEEMTEYGLQDVGYKDLDMRCVTAIRRSNYWKAEWKKKVSEIDFKNERRRRLADSELDYQSKLVARNIYRHLHEPQICLSGKNWKL